jgi:hypothetical protein
MRPTPSARYQVPARRLLTALAATGVLLCATPGLAHGDGDPASDVLAQAPPVFIPPASGITYGQESAVAAQLRAAARQGRPLRVAVIPDRIALGSIGGLWKRPGVYAEFLGGELSFYYHGELLVVMPDGFGVSRNGKPVSTPLARLAPRRGELLLATEQAIAKLTGAGAHSTAMTAASTPSRTAGIGWWAATLAAVLATVGAWTVSLRARPPAVRSLRARRATR